MSSLYDKVSSRLTVETILVRFFFAKSSSASTNCTVRTIENRCLGGGPVFDGADIALVRDKDAAAAAALISIRKCNRLAARVARIYHYRHIVMKPFP